MYLTLLHLSGHKTQREEEHERERQREDRGRMEWKKEEAKLVLGSLT